MDTKKQYQDSNGRLAKGNPGKPKGAKNKKTLMWDALGEYICNDGSKKALDIIKGYEDEKFVAAFEKFLEYFKPKQQRADAHGDQSININLHFDGDDAKV